MTSGPFPTARARAVGLRADPTFKLEAGAPATAWLAAALRRYDIVTHVFRPGEGFGAEVIGYLDRDGSVIYVAERLDARRALVATAHELGHLLLHGDPSATAHVTAAGISTLGYSTREDRELEADAFAAEFLLPATLLRAMLEEGLDAGRIAEETGVPNAIVLHQAPLALLASSSERSGVSGVERLDALQTIAVRAASTRTVVEGGIGTGKTITLAAKLRRLVTDGADPTTILVLAPSARGAAAIRARVAGSATDSMARIATCRTFALDIVLRWPESAGRSRTVRLLDETAALARLRAAALACGQASSSPPSALRTIIALKEALIDPATTMAREEASAATTRIGRLYEAYDSILRRDDAIDVGDLPRLAGIILKGDASARASCSRGIRHVLVDDIHDLDAASLSLVETIIACGSTLWATCNPSGTVFGYRGAVGMNGAAFKHRFGGDGLTLSENHRSSTAIADAMRRFEGRPPTGNAPGSRQRIVARVHATGDAEAEAVVSRITSLRKRGVALGAQAVMARTRKALDRIAHSLAKVGLASTDRDDLHEREDVRALLAYLEDAASARDGLVEPTVSFPPDPMAAPPGLHALLADFVFDGGGQHLDAWFGTGVGSADARRAVASLLTVCREQDGMKDRDAAALLERLRRLRSFNQITASPSFERRGEDAVVLTTIHGAVGMEFPVVHLIGVAGGLMPATRRYGEAGSTAANPAPSECEMAASEARLMLVAMGSGRERLYMSGALAYGRRRHATSPFLREFREDRRPASA